MLTILTNICPCVGLLVDRHLPSAGVYPSEFAVLEVGSGWASPWGMSLSAGIPAVETVSIALTRPSLGRKKSQLRSGWILVVRFAWRDYRPRAEFCIVEELLPVQLGENFRPPQTGRLTQMDINCAGTT